MREIVSCTMRQLQAPGIARSQGALPPSEEPPSTVDSRRRTLTMPLSSLARESLAWTAVRLMSTNGEAWTTAAASASTLRAARRML